MSQGWCWAGLLLLAAFGCLDFSAIRRRWWLAFIACAWLLSALIPPHPTLSVAYVVLCGAGIVWLAAADADARWRTLAAFGLSAAVTLLLRILLPLEEGQLRLLPWLWAAMATGVGLGASARPLPALWGAVFAFGAQECLYSKAATWIGRVYVPYYGGALQLVFCSIAWLALAAITAKAIVRFSPASQKVPNNA